MSDSHANKSRERCPFLNNTEALALAICCLSGALFPLRAAHAVTVDPGDYVAAPPGTNVLIQYLQYGRDDGINIEGAGDLSAHLDSEIGIFRAIHFASLFGFTVDPQIIIPFGGLKNGQIGGQPQNSSSGLGDPIVGASFWLINRPETSTYFAFSPLVTLPLGQYRRSNAINLGNDRYQGDLQVAFQTAFGSEGVAKQVVVALFADANFFSANTRSAVRANSALTQATLTQSTSYQLQSWLTYTTNVGVTVSAGYSATMGGRESLGGSPNGFRTEEQQARFEVQAFVAKRWQLAGELTHDVHVVGGFRQEIGINGRILFVF
jgi:hypothetical protein